MKKRLFLLLSIASVSTFAESFQDFNNNAYLQLNNTYISNGGAGNQQGYTLGTTIQSKSNIWINAEAYGSPANSNNWPGQVVGVPVNFGGSTYGQFLATVKAGYAFQFLNGNTNGFQVIPYATFTYGTSLGAIDQYYGIGVKGEYRFANVLKVSLDTTAYSANQSGGGQIPATVNPVFQNNLSFGDVQSTRYTINPEIQYDIAKTLLLGVGYKYDQSFAASSPINDGNSTVYVRVGYLF